MTIAARPTVPGSRYAARLAAAGEAAGTAGVDALLIGVGSDLRYLTGYEAMPLERLTLLVVRPSSAPIIVVPRLERGAAEAGLHTAVEIRTWDETDDPYALAVDGLVGAGRVAVSDTMLAMHVLRLQASLGQGTRRRAGVGGPARACGWSRTPTRSRSCAWRPRPPTGSSTRSPPGG